VNTTAPGGRPSFGIATAPSQVAYGDILRVWREADNVPQLEHAWLYDHLMPIFGDPHGATFEGWTLLAALAGQTERLRLGLLVTSNRFRPPAILAKIAAGVDVISGGRLEFGIGAGSNLTVPTARREYEAYGLPFHDAGYATGSLAEACTIIRRLWADPEPFDFDGSYYQLTGAFSSPKPVQIPHPPIMIGGRASSTLRVIAEHADRWNMPGGSIEQAIERSAALDRLCAEIGRDPAEITRSYILGASYDQPDETLGTIRAAIDAGFSHLVLSLRAPYPADIAHWVADTFVAPFTD
jgi:alkanesulfonate monooxygenase SsuD/methylene tetrahydromethanopterin reductase-like flavin-dependent oxidoreductase (luciferase family)